MPIQLPINTLIPLLALFIQSTVCLQSWRSAQSPSRGALKTIEVKLASLTPERVRASWAFCLSNGERLWLSQRLVAKRGRPVPNGAIN